MALAFRVHTIKKHKLVSFLLNWLMFTVKCTATEIVSYIYSLNLFVEEGSEKGLSDKQLHRKLNKFIK